MSTLNSRKAVIALLAVVALVAGVVAGFPSKGGGQVVYGDRQVTNEVLKKMKPYLISYGRYFGELPSVMAAQSLLESGMSSDDVKAPLEWGKPSTNHKKALIQGYNFWGMKCTSTAKYKECRQTRTSEVYGGSKVHITDGFMIFNSIEQGIEVRAGWWWRHAGGNKEVVRRWMRGSSTNWEEYGKVMGQSGYYTESSEEYNRTLGSILKGHPEFLEWDKLAFPNGRKCSGDPKSTKPETRREGKYDYPKDEYNFIEDGKPGPSSSGSGTVSGPEGGAGKDGGVVSEDELIGMPKITYLYTKQGVLKAATRDGLAVREQVNLVETHRAIQERKDSTQSDLVRVAVSFAGIGMVVWGVVILIGFAIDRVLNPLVSVSRVLTLAKGDKRLEPMGVGNLVLVESVVIGAGVLLMSGVAYKAIQIVLGMTAQ